MRVTALYRCTAVLCLGGLTSAPTCLLSMGRYITEWQLHTCWIRCLQFSVCSCECVSIHLQRREEIKHDNYPVFGSWGMYVFCWCSLLYHVLHMLLKLLLLHHLFVFWILQVSSIPRWWYTGDSTWLACPVSLTQSQGVDYHRNEFCCLIMLAFLDHRETGRQIWCSVLFLLEQTSFLS